jgi:hypothetical protein
MRTSSGVQPPTLQPHYRVYAAVVSRRTPVARVCQACCAGQNALIPCRHVPEPAGKPTRRWDALRITARRRRALTSDPRVGRRVSMSNRAGAGPKTRQPSPAWNQAYRRSSHSEGTEVRSGLCGRLKSRTHTRVEAERRHFVGPKPWKRCLCPRRCRSGAVEPGSWGFRAAEAAASTSGISSDRLRARPAEAGRGRVVGVTVHRGGWPSQRCRSRLAEARFERLPIAACRSRLTFGGVDLSGLRGDRARRLPACPGSTREAGMPTGH